MKQFNRHMQRLHQILFSVSILAFSWYAMMAIHELGHVTGAILTGGLIERVVLHPLTISRTELADNPHPGIVVWLGPLMGCAFPVAIDKMMSPRLGITHHVTRFFAGFCLIANGAYVAFGTAMQVGDCGEMLRTGTPLSVMLMFGILAISWGLFLWHRLGSITEFVANPSIVSARSAYVTLFGTLFLIASEMLLL